jgi:hypothetical protein
VVVVGVNLPMYLNGVIPSRKCSIKAYLYRGNNCRELRERYTSLLNSWHFFSNIKPIYSELLFETGPGIVK